jgi:benzoyl-CoA reductase/2-hydroxyglutaryl-CoA dehydratase subunit BcrC/BadD/HgdB
VAGTSPAIADLRREIVRANDARAAARRLLGFRRMGPHVTGAEVSSWMAAFWDMEPDAYVAAVNDACSAIATRPALDGPRVLLAGAPVDGPELYRTIESHGAVVVAEVGPWPEIAAGDDVRVDDDPICAVADKYRAAAIGARTPAALLERWIEGMLDGVDAVVVSLPPHDAVFGWDYPALRRVLQARGIPHVCLRGEQHDPPTQEDHARLDAMVSAASTPQAARHG